ncbi:MAG: hypothetical protein ACP5NQ_07140 [Vulcanisaeta sp.]
MIINIRLYIVEDRDEKYLEVIKRIIKDTVDELGLHNSIIRFTVEVVLFPCFVG